MKITREVKSLIYEKLDDCWYTNNESVIDRRFNPIEYLFDAKCAIYDKSNKLCWYRYIII